MYTRHGRSPGSLRRGRRRPDGRRNPLSTHILTATRFDFDAFRARADADVGPGHTVLDLAEALGADIHQPGDAEPTVLDRLGALVVGSAEQWALARSVLGRAEGDPIVYATGEDVGLTTALLARGLRPGATVAVNYSAPGRKRARWLTRLLDRAGVRLVAVTGTPDKAAVLRRLLPADRVVLVPEQTDTQFFRPDPTLDRTEGRPLIVSCGMEQRDYETLGAAVADLDVDVKICMASPNFTDRTTIAMPAAFPDNVEAAPFAFDELRELYQRARVTVLPLLPNDYSAGLTALMEAMASGSPVVITRNPGLGADLIDLDLAAGVPPRDAAAMRAAIQEILDDPEGSAARAERARNRVIDQHSRRHWATFVANALRRRATVG